MARHVPSRVSSMVAAAAAALLFVGSTDVYMFFSTGGDLYPSSASGGTGTFKLYGLKDNGAGLAAPQIGEDMEGLADLSDNIANARARACGRCAVTTVRFTTSYARWRKSCRPCARVIVKSGSRRTVLTGSTASSLVTTMRSLYG